MEPADEDLPRVDLLFEASLRGYDRTEVETLLALLGERIRAADALVEGTEQVLRRLQTEGPDAAVEVPSGDVLPVAVPELAVRFRGYQREQVDDYVGWQQERLGMAADHLHDLRRQIDRLRRGGTG